MSITATASVASALPDLRAASTRATAAPSLLASKAGVSNPITIPSVSAPTTETDPSAGQSTIQDGVGQAGGRKGGGGASSTSESTLEDLIAAAKRKVQPQVGASGADEVVGKDGSIDYKKLADLIAKQQAQVQQAQTSGQAPKAPIPSSAPLLDLFA